MNKEQFVKKVAEKAGVTQKEANAVVSAAIEAIKEVLANGEKLQLVGFGTFAVKDVAERKGRNPKTGEEIVIPATKRPIFRAGQTLKSLVK